MRNGLLTAPGFRNIIILRRECKCGGYLANPRRANNISYSHPFITRAQQKLSLVSSESSELARHGIHRAQQKLTIVSSKSSELARHGLHLAQTKNSSFNTNKAKIGEGYEQAFFSHKIDNCTSHICISDTDTFIRFAPRIFR